MILQPPGSILAGASGSGKTAAIATQLMYGMEVFVIVTEPDGVASLLDACERLKAPVDKLHWAQCFPHASGWMDLEEMLIKVNSLDQEGLAKQRDMGKSTFKDAAMSMLRAFKNFHCDRTGKDYGDVSKFDDKCYLNVDTLTGWCEIGWGCVVGYKPTANQGEWGIAQNVVLSMMRTVNSGRRCFFNLNAHIEKEMDEMLGVKKITLSAIGAKMAPKIPKDFSEIIKTERIMLTDTKAEFRWSTLDIGMDLKNRALPINAKMKADFGPIIEAYRRRVKFATPEVVSPPQSEGAKQVPAPLQLPAAPMTPQPGTARSI